jgi:hypothetical protein
MGEDAIDANKLNATQLINANTVVVLNLKNVLMGILTMGGTLLTIFFGFYMLVVVPKIESVEKHYEQMFEAQATENKSIRMELNNLNTGISTLTGTINAINRNNPAATTSGNDWGAEIANATQSIKGLGKKGATQIPEALKKKVNNPTQQVVSANNNTNEDDEWINTIFDFEDTKGSRGGGPMLYNGEKNFGFNKYSDELIKIKDIGKRKQRAIELFKKDILPQVKHLPLEIRKRAADLIYNGGQDPRTFLIYAAKGADSIPQDITERQKYWGQAYDKKEIDKLWKQNKDLVEQKLKDPDFVNSLDEIRNDYYNRLSDKEAYNNSWIHRLKIFNKKNN